MAVTPLTEFHDTAEFRCGVESLDRWLNKAGLAVQAQGNAAVHIAEGESGNVLGYFALSPHEPHSISLPRRVRNQGTRTPALLLGKLALHESQRGKRLGPNLVLEALRVAVQAAPLIGGRIIVVDARDAKVRQFYENIDFLPTSPMTPLKLYMRMSTAKGLIEEFDRSQAAEELPA